MPETTETNALAEALELGADFAAAILFRAQWPYDDSDWPDVRRDAEKVRDTLNAARALASSPPVGGERPTVVLDDTSGPDEVFEACVDAAIARDFDRVEQLKARLDIRLVGAPPVPPQDDALVERLRVALREFAIGERGCGVCNAIWQRHAEDEWHYDFCVLAAVRAPHSPTPTEEVANG